MGFLDNVVGALFSGTHESCPECGSRLRSDGPPDDRGDERFECTNRNCNDPVWFRENGGPLVNPRQRTTGGSNRRCNGCQQPLAGSELTAPYEDGNNPHAYVTCRHCGTQNIMFGFGEDDD